VLPTGRMYIVGGQDDLGSGGVRANGESTAPPPPSSPQTHTPTTRNPHTHPPASVWTIYIQPQHTHHNQHHTHIYRTKCWQPELTQLQFGKGVLVASAARVCGCPSVVWGRIVWGHPTAPTHGQAT
jgi:hypothetical protein